MYAVVLLYSCVLPTRICGDFDHSTGHMKKFATWHGHCFA